MITQSEKRFGDTVDKPELFIGLVGPIGVELEPVQNAIISELRDVGYRTEFIKVTDLMKLWPIPGTEVKEDSYSSYYRSLIDYADGFRRHCDSHSALAALSIHEIRKRRSSILSSGDIENGKQTVEPALGTAYLVRQFKLPQEIESMRKAYGRKFIQISVYLSKDERKKALMKQIQQFGSAPISPSDTEKQAIDLMEIDANEEREEFGQRITDVFHLGDVFVDGSSKSTVHETVKRYFTAFFGSNAISPSKTEYGMYTAAGAALRSIDLSRQVGAAIFTDHGEVITLGCNEVPKAFGGTYWEDDEEETHRDFEEGSDANQNRKIEILHDFVTRLEKLDQFGDEHKSSPSTHERVDRLLNDKSMQASQLMDIIEYGRMVHAEMNAITDSARLGKSIRNAILFCTTFPCHMCAKHIVSAGIKKVVFLEPYPKSYAENLHSDSITFNPQEKEYKVLFEPFIGISPRRYRDIFEKRKRKSSDGKTRNWYENSPIPRIEDRSSAYLENEIPEMMLGGLKNLDPDSF